MEIMLCPSTVSSASNEHMRLVDGDVLQELPCEGEQITGSFDKLLEQIVMTKCGMLQGAGSAARAALEDECPLQQDLDEQEAEDNTVSWYSVITPPTWLSQNLTVVLGDVERGDMQGVCELELSGVDGLSGKVDVPVSTELVLEQKVAISSGTSSREQVDIELAAFDDEVLQSVSMTGVIERDPDEHKPEVLMVSTFERGVMDEHMSVKEESSGSVSTKLETHRAPELYLQTLEKGTEFEELFVDTVSNTRGVSGSNFVNEQYGEMSSQYLHKNAASYVKDFAETVEPELKADKERIPIVALGGVSRTNEQESVVLPNVQDQIGEVHERTIPEQVIESVQYFEDAETKEFDIELTPRELGRVRVSITTDGESVNVHLVAENPSVAEVIRAELPALRDVLARQGLMFGQVDVGVRQDESTKDNAEYRLPTRSAYPVKGVEHHAEHGISHQFGRTDAYGLATRSQVDYVA